MSWSWVASSSVTPISRFSPVNRSSTIRPFSESRLPVGSSAMSESRAMNQRPGDGRRAASRRPTVAGDSDARRPPSPTRSSRLRAAGSTAADRPPASRTGSATFSSTVNVGSRLKNWKTKPTRSRLIRVSSSSPRSAERDAFEPDGAGRRAIHGAADVQKRGLAATGWPDERHELARVERERDARHRLDSRVADDVRSMNVVGDEEHPTIVAAR